MTRLEIIGLIGTIFTLIGFPITVLALYISPPARWELPFQDRYNRVYGNYKMFNISRERILTSAGKLRVVEWDVKITKRFLKIPHFHASYKDKAGVYDYFYNGELFMLGSRFIVRLSGSPRTDDYDDICEIVFSKPRDNKIDVQIGFLAGYRNPTVPYCGVHILCRENRISREEAGIILSDDSSLWFEDFEHRAFLLLEKKTEHKAVV